LTSEIAGLPIFAQSQPSEYGCICRTDHCELSDRALNDSDKRGFSTHSMGVSPNLQSLRLAGLREFECHSLIK
jgi:hypothetical protein